MTRLRPLLSLNLNLSLILSLNLILSLILNLSLSLSLSLILFSCTPNQTSQDPHTHTPTQTDSPSIVLIMTDDQGYGDFGFTGNDVIRTPVCDKLSTESVNFDRFYVSPVCAPTRASLLTGRYHLRTGTTWVTHRKEVMRAEEVTLAESLKEAGYATGIFGKWHNGEQYPNDPTGQGFDEFLGFTAGHWNNYFNTTLTHNGETVKTTGFITDVLTDFAIDFITRNRDRPFFCYIPYNAPHGPFQVLDRYFDYYKAQGLNDKDAAVYGMCENIDDNVGRILAELDSLGLVQNTIVIFTTDNGPNGDRYNGGMRGIKASVHEGGVRVPLLVRWPERLEPKLVPQLTAHIDILPTLIELVGADHPDSILLDGRSMVPLLEGEDQNWESRSLFTHQVNREVKMTPGAVRTDQYRLIYTPDQIMLFDMIKDPGEQNDLADQFPQVVSELKHQYEDWFNSSIQGGGEAPPIPVGYPQSPVVQLPAPEARLTGGIEFQGGMGWANDWIVSWDQPDGAASWSLDFATAGSYQIQLEYGAAQKAQFQVVMGERRLVMTIPDTSEIETLPSPDRIPRGEVYEKIWHRMTPGSFQVPEGEHTLVVTALGSGCDGLELKSVILTRED